MSSPQKIGSLGRPAFRPPAPEQPVGGAGQVAVQGEAARLWVVVVCRAALVGSAGPERTSLGGVLSGGPWDCVVRVVSGSTQRTPGTRLSRCSPAAGPVTS